MKKFLTALTLLLIIALAGSISAEIKLTGDARLRPRLDIKDNGEYGNKTTDGYYYYRARLNLKSSLGDGWFGHVQLGTNGFAYWTGKFGDPSASDASKPSSSSVDGASRGTVDFMLIYFGRKTDKFGYWGGLIPVDGLNNPLLDVHYYSDKMIDVPFFEYSNNGAHGFGGYIGFNNGTKVNATILVDNNEGIKTEDSDGETISNTHDQYSVILDVPLKLGEAIVQPVLIATMADRGMDAPLTYGVNLTSPKVGQFKFSGTLAMSTQSAGGDAAEYDVWFVRAKADGKIGSGTLTAWVDLASKDFDKIDVTHDFTYWWLAYTIPVYKSDNGSVSIKPTWRHVAEEVDGSKDYTRDKFELTIDLKFM